MAFVHVPEIHDVNYGTPPIDSDGGELLKRDLAKGETKEVVLCDHCRRAALSEDGSIAVYVDAMGGLDKFCYVATGEAHGKYLGACGNRIGISWDGRYVAFPARMDALSDPKDEERFGGPGGAMIYDREKDAFTPAWKI